MLSLAEQRLLLNSRSGHIVCAIRIWSQAVAHSLHLRDDALHFVVREHRRFSES